MVNGSAHGSAENVATHKRPTAVKIYFVAKTVNSTQAKVTQGIVERKHWVTLKKELAADGFVITYWNSVSDTVWEDVAA